MLAFLYTQNRVGGKIPSTLKIIEPFYLEIEILGDFSQEDYNHFYDKMCGEFSFLNSKIETKGYVQLMREKSGRN